MSLRLPDLKTIEDKSEDFFFWTRWLAAPIYFCLALSLIAFSLRAAMDVYEIMRAALTNNDLMNEKASELVDLSMFSGLVTICMFCGYEIFISKLNNVHGHKDSPRWLLHINFHDIKKLTLGTMSVMGCVNLLKLGYQEAPMADIVRWIAIVATLSGSALFLALMERLAPKKPKESKTKNAVDSVDHGQNVTVNLISEAPSEEH